MSEADPGKGMVILRVGELGSDTSRTSIPSCFVERKAKSATAAFQEMETRFGIP